MADRNPHTGDSLISKVNSKEYEENYDRIFKKKENACVNHDCNCEPRSEGWCQMKKEVE